MPDKPQKILITGAEGLIGGLLFRHLSSRPDLYEPHAMIRPERFPWALWRRPPCTFPRERLHRADLVDLPALRRGVQGMETVVHLAATPHPDSTWDTVLYSNIVGTYHLFEACRLAQVKRVVIASSVQVVFGYGDVEPYESLLQGKYQGPLPEDYRPLTLDLPPRPLNLYAASKVFGESLAHVYAHAHGLSCLCLRIGWVTKDDLLPIPAARSLWCSHRDVVQLMEKAITAPESLRFDVFFGQSANRLNLVDLSHTRDVLGFAPQDGV